MEKTFFQLIFTLFFYLIDPKNDLFNETGNTLFFIIGLIHVGFICVTFCMCVGQDSKGTIPNISKTIVDSNIMKPGGNILNHPCTHIVPR